uniref:Uncharacterized protein n=1 Tax=Oryza brachyantha TaxID=4533 RepID=J3KZM8_ORYBR
MICSIVFPFQFDEFVAVRRVAKSEHDGTTIPIPPRPIETQAGTYIQKRGFHTRGTNPAMVETGSGQEETEPSDSPTLSRRWGRSAAPRRARRGGPR